MGSSSRKRGSAVNEKTAALCAIESAAPHLREPRRGTAHAAECKDVETDDTKRTILGGARQRRHEHPGIGLDQEAREGSVPARKRTQRIADAAAHGELRQGRDAGGTGEADTHGYVDAREAERLQ